ncbi:hypothetical protein V6Z11_D02G036800, partial [Gossypium hirsutum]
PLCLFAADLFPPFPFFSFSLCHSFDCLLNQSTFFFSTSETKKADDIPTVTVAIAGSIVDNAQSLELATRSQGGIHHLESGFEKSNAGKSLVSEEGIQAGRKRRVDSSPSRGTKKRRQTKDASVIQEEDCAHSVNSTEPNSLPDQPVSLSYDQSQGGADETNALVVDKITEILEETFEKKDIVAESMQGIPQSGGMCSLASASGENGGSGDPVIVQEAHLGKVSQVTKPYQPMKDVSEGGTKLEDNVVPKLDENEKIGMRTRSKQKL